MYMPQSTTYGAESYILPTNYGLDNFLRYTELSQLGKMCNLVIRKSSGI